MASKKKENKKAKEFLANEIDQKTITRPVGAVDPKVDHTHLGTGMPPVALGHNTGKNKVRLEEKPHVAGQMKKSSKGKTALKGAAILGGIAAGAFAIYKAVDSSPSVGNSIAGWLPNGEPVTIRKRRTVRAKSSAVYAEWRNLENLPNILSHLEKVEVQEGGRSYWQAKGPAGTSVSWFATITEDEPGRAISWQAEKEAEVPNSGRIVFAEKPNGDTLIEVRLTYQPPAGELGQSIAAAFGENPAKQIEDDLTNFKFAMEEKAGTATAEKA